MCTELGFSTAKQVRGNRTIQCLIMSGCIPKYEHLTKNLRHLKKIASMEEKLQDENPRINSGGQIHGTKQNLKMIILKCLLGSYHFYSKLSGLNNTHLLPLEVRSLE